MDCVVTGGAGFIGSNLVDALMARSDRVTVIDTLVTGKRENLAEALAAGARLETVDVRDADAVRGVFEAASPELVFHLAAQIDGRRAVRRRRRAPHPRGQPHPSLGPLRPEQARR